MEFLTPSFPFLLTLLLFLLMVVKIAKKSKTINNLVPNPPPGPWKLPLIGNLHQVIGSTLPHHCLRNLANRYGPLMQLRLGEISIVVISSAETAKEMMKTHDIIFASRPFFFIVSIINYDSTSMSFAPYGNYWRQLRKICTLEVFSAKRVKSFKPLRVQEFSNLIESISAHAGVQINLSNMILSTTSAIISRAAFGKKYQDQEEFISLVEELMHLGGGLNVADVFPSYKLLLSISGMRRKIQKIHSKIDRILENIIAEHKEKDTRNNTGEVEEDEDLVDVLLKVHEDGDLEFPFTINNIKAVILDIFIGGSETSSTIVEWAISELLKNPRMMEKAQAEVRNVYSKKGYVDEEGLDELRYLNLVIKETMRLHPPLPLSVPRECREKCQINGYEVPAKSIVIVNLYAISRDPKYWTDAECFNPERFLDSSVDYKGNNFHYIPFGAGRRMCPGMTFGLANIELPLAQLLYHFDWKLADGKKNEDLDMTEAFGASVRRENDLYVIPIPYYPSLGLIDEKLQVS